MADDNGNKGDGSPSLFRPRLFFLLCFGFVLYEHITKIKRVLVMHHKKCLENSPSNDAVSGLVVRS